MAMDLKSLEELKAHAERALKQTAEQIRGASDNYFTFIQRAMSSYPSGGTELAEELKSYTKKNIAAAEEFVDKLSQAKDLQDVVRIQTEFVQMQLNAFGEQAKNSRRHIYKGDKRCDADAFPTILIGRQFYTVAHPLPKLCKLIAIYSV